VNFGAAVHLPLVVDIEEVGGVAVGVVDLARALPAVRLAGVFADRGHRLRRAQEGRQVAGEALGGDHPDHAVPPGAPGQGRARGRGQGGDQGDTGEQAGRRLHARSNELTAPTAWLRRPVDHDDSPGPPDLPKTCAPPQKPRRLRFMPPGRRPPDRTAPAVQRQHAIPCQLGAAARPGTKLRFERWRRAPPLRMQRGIRSPASGLSRARDLSNQAADRHSTPIRGTPRCDARLRDFWPSRPCPSPSPPWPPIPTSRAIRSVT
jgi:hypothetical protein